MEGMARIMRTAHAICKTLMREAAIANGHDKGTI